MSRHLYGTWKELHWCERLCLSHKQKSQNYEYSQSSTNNMIDAWCRDKLFIRRGNPSHLCGTSLIILLPNKQRTNFIHIQRYSVEISILCVSQIRSCYSHRFKNAFQFRYFSNIYIKRLRYKVIFFIAIRYCSLISLKL